MWKPIQSLSLSPSFVLLHYISPRIWKRRNPSTAAAHTKWCIKNNGFRISHYVAEPDMEDLDAVLFIRLDIC